MNTRGTTAATLGVRDAWDHWLAQHPYSVPEIVEASIRSAVIDWLTQNEDTVIDAIAGAVRSGYDDPRATVA